jgi:hypothetical protein
MPPPGAPPVVYRSDFQYRYASDPFANRPAAATLTEIPANDTRIRASVLSLEPDSPKLDTDEKKLAFVAQVREVIETLLYTGTSKEEAEKQGRKTWFDPATYRLTITDTAERIAVVREYLQGVPELEKSNPALSARRTSTGFGGAHALSSDMVGTRARVEADGARVRTLERTLAPLREGMSKEIADKLPR